jgi:hypothetical protein
MGNIFLTAIPSIARNLAGSTTTPYLYVADSGNNRIQVFDRTLSHNYLFSIGPVIAGLTGNLSSPYGVCNDGTSLWITDTGNNRVVQTDLLGNFIATWGSAGAFIGQFDRPLGIAVDDNYVWVVDSNNNRFQVFVKADGTWVFMLGTYGSGDFEFDHPTDCFVDTAYFWIDDAGNSRWLYFEKDFAIETYGNIQWPNLNIVVEAQAETRSIFGNILWPGLDWIVEATATIGNSAEGDIVWPEWEVEAYTGGEGDIVWPEWEVDGELSAGNLISGDCVFPGWRVDATAEQENLATGNIIWPGLRVSGILLSGSLAEGNIIWPGWDLRGNAISGYNAVGDLIFPEWTVDGLLKSAPILDGDCVFPGWNIYGILSQAAAIDIFACFVMNVTNKALSKYTGYPFVGFAYFNGNYYATDGKTGIFNLAGDTDNGVAITGEIRFRIEDMDATGQKHKIREAWITGRNLDGATLYLEEDGGRLIPLQRVYTKKTGLLEEMRFKAPRGLRGRFYSVVFKGAGKFYIDTLKLFDEGMPERVR